jgi:hypothetical protein
MVALDALEGLEVCEPWPESGLEECAPHEAHFPGGPGCEAIGSSCPSDGWPADLPATDVVYVRDGAPSGGDGSRASPVSTLSEGIALVPDGGVVAVATGAYDGRFEIDRPMTVVGACPEGVILTRVDGVSGTGIVAVTDTGPVELEDVTLRSSRTQQLLLDDSDVSVRSVALDGAGVIQSGGSIVVENVVARDFGDDVFATINLSAATSATISRLSVCDSRAGGVSITSTDAIDVSDVVVHGAGYVGLQLGGGGGRMARVVVEDAVEGGLLVDAPVEVEDVVVRRVRRAELGVAFGYFAPVTQTVERARIEEAADVAMSFGYGGGTVRDLVIAGTRASTSSIGRGLEVAGGATLTVERAAILGTSDLAILVDGTTTQAALSDLVVDEVGPATGGSFGRCLHGQVGASVTVTRAVFRRCREAAVTASYTGQITLRDARIERTLPVACELACEEPRAGIGIVALGMGGRIDAERFVVSESALAGVQIVAGGETDLRDGTIERNPVGLNVQVEEYELSRLMRQVVFRDNGVNLDSVELPVPAAMTATSTP